MEVLARCLLTCKPVFVEHMDPKNAERRRRGQSRGGKAKASGEIRDLKKQLGDLVEDVRKGRMECGDAVVIDQILNTRARLKLNWSARSGSKTRLSSVSRCWRQSGREVGREVRRDGAEGQASDVGGGRR